MTCLIALSSMQSQAATYTWQPVTGANNWNVSGNWVVTLPSGPAAAPVPGAAGGIISLIANSTAAQTITLNASSTLGILNIGDPTTGFFGYTLTPTGGSTLTFDNNAAAAQIIQDSKNANPPGRIKTII